MKLKRPLATALVFGAVAGLCGCNKPTDVQPLAEAESTPTSEPAPLTTLDQVFLNKLDSAGITYASPHDAVGAAETVCDLLPLNGYTTTRQIVADETDATPTQAGQFVVFSASYYCPNALTRKDTP